MRSPYRILCKRLCKTGDDTMIPLKRLICSLLCAGTLALTAITPLAFAGLLEPYFQHKTFPQCDDVKVLGQIVERFNWAEDKTWQRGFYLEDIERVRERVVQETHISQVPRRYCRAHARLTNGRHPTIYYLIEGGQGFAGNKFGLEFCLGGLDRWNEFDGSCRTLRY